MRKKPRASDKSRIICLALNKVKEIDAITDEVGKCRDKLRERLSELEDLVECLDDAEMWLNTGARDLEAALERLNELV